MLVGTAIALIQALTQIQEVTLTFVPKIIVILLVVAVSGSFIGAHLSTFTEVVFAHRARLLIRAGSSPSRHPFA